MPSPDRHFANAAIFTQSTGVTPNSGDAALYIKTDNKLYVKNSSGTEAQVTADMVGATSSVAGTAGLVPAPAAGDQEKFLRGNATWQSQYPYFLTHPQRFEAGDYLLAPAYTTDTSAANAGFMTVYPIFLPTLTVDRIGVEVTAVGGVGTLSRLGIYNSSASTNYPSTLLLDAGTVAASGSTGKKEITINQSITQGIYWLAHLSDTVVTSAASFRRYGMVGVPNFRKNQNDSNFQMNHGYRAGSVASGGLPASFPAGATLIEAGSLGIHIVYLRVA